MNHVRIFLPVLPVFLGATPPSVWTADKFYTWLQEYYPSILAGAKFTPGAFFEAWTGALAVQLAEVPEGKNRTLIAKARMGELQHKSDRISAMIAIQISHEARGRVSLSEADLSPPGTTFQLTTPSFDTRPSMALQNGPSTASTTAIPVFKQPIGPGPVSRPTALQSGSSTPSTAPTHSFQQVTTPGLISRPSTALRNGSTLSTTPVHTFRQTTTPCPISRSNTLQSASANPYVGPSTHPLHSSFHPTPPSRHRLPRASHRLSTPKSTSKITNPSTGTIGKRKMTHHDQYPSKHYNGRTVFVISDSDSESIADDMHSTPDLEMDDEGEGWEGEGESGWEDEDSDSSWDSEKDQSAPVLMKLGFKPMIDINLKCNNYIRQLCADIYSSGAQTIVLFDWDNQPVPESMLSINPRDSGVYSIIVQGRTSKSPTGNWLQRHGYIITTPRPFKEAADHEMFMLVCSLLYAGILHDKIVVVVTADIGMENIMLYMNERSISSVRLTARDLIPYLNRIVPGCFKDRRSMQSKIVQVASSEPKIKKPKKRLHYHMMK